jgi:hypothetical protein
MTIATMRHVTISLTAKIKAKFGSSSRGTSATGAAKRTNAKFLIACGMQLITILVMLTRALINKQFVL